jgi:hypothetical protein
VKPPSADPVTARLDEMLEELAAVIARIDRLARLEKLRGVTAAVQAAESVRFALSQPTP